MDSRDRILKVLRGEIPDRVPFAPNIWQWFEHHRLNGLLPQEIADCASHLDAMKVLGVDIFSRNLITPIKEKWFGGHARAVHSEVLVEETSEGNSRLIVYHTPHGSISEAFRFQDEGSTLVQEEYLFKDFDSEYLAWKSLFEDKEFLFDRDSYLRLRERVADGGVVIAGEVTCPLKQLYMLARPDHAVYLLADHEAEMVELMEIYAAKALNLIREMVHLGVEVVMTMDNLDSTFYPPPYFRRYCSDFFRRASEICHSAGAFFFSHACGQQKSILPLVVECGIDGLEGIAFPPLGDVELWEAKSAGDRFIVMGGLSAVQLEGAVTSRTAEHYVSRLFQKMRPFDRFILSMSCNTSIKATWDALRFYRDAWLEYRG